MLHNQLVDVTTFLKVFPLVKSLGASEDSPKVYPIQGVRNSVLGCTRKRTLWEIFRNFTYIQEFFVLLVAYF